MAQLRSYKDTGEILFDTNLICYGLVKSGYMAYQQAWTRKIMPNPSRDPNYGGNWTQSVAQTSLNWADDVWGFTLTNAISPIVFITGVGCLVGSRVSGSTITFYYTNASASTKFYCFDLMGNFLTGSPYLKTYDTTGRITFNSLQPALNIVGSVQAPGPGATFPNGSYRSVYTGGYNYQTQANQTVGGITYVAKANSVVDIPLTGGVEYAAFLPWSRSCGINDLFDGNAYPYTRYSGSEGAYGRVGGVSFVMGATAATTDSTPNSGPGIPLPVSFDNLPIDRFPSALVIQTSTLPFPFN